LYYFNDAGDAFSGVMDSSSSLPTLTAGVIEETFQTGQGKWTGNLRGEAAKVVAQLSAVKSELADASGKLAALAARVSVMILPKYVRDLDLQLPGLTVGNVYRMTIEASDILSAAEEGVTVGETCWGIDVYKMNSNPAVAAVHAGVAKGGLSNTVYIRAEEGRMAYEGSTRNGVRSDAFGDGCLMSYEFLSILPYGEGTLLLDRRGVTVYFIEAKYPVTLPS
jgi:hypothetical protein